MKTNFGNKGTFIILIKSSSAELVFINNINLDVLTLKLSCFKQSPSEYRNIEQAQLEKVLGCKTQVIYQTKCIGAADKEAVMQMMLGLMAGLSTQFNEQGLVDDVIGSTSYLILDSSLVYTYISYFHKENMRNAYGICIDPPKLNNLLEAAHYANAYKISPITEDFAEKHGWNHLNCLEMVVSENLDDPNPIKREQWVLYKNSGWLRDHVFSCYSCGTTTTQRCDCWGDGLESIKVDYSPRLGGSI